MCQRISLKIHHFILVKLLRFQGTFHEKSFVSGLGADAPTFSAYTKNAALPCFFNCRQQLELRSKPCFKRLLKKPLKNPHTPFFRRKVCQRTSLKMHHFILAKLLRFQRAFHEKSFVSGFGADAPTYNAQKKHGVAVLLILLKNVDWACKPGSVENNHLSATYVAIRLIQFLELPPRAKLSFWSGKTV